QYSRRARIAQSSALLIIANEPASPVRDVSKGEACPTKSGFLADQDMATIAKSSTLPHDSAPRVTSPVADEGSMQQTISKLMALCTSLQRQHSELLAKFQAQEVEILSTKGSSPAADEGSMQQTLHELTALCTSLQRQHSKMVARFEAQGLEIKSLKARIQVLKDKDRGVAAQSGDDAPIKGMRLDVGDEVAERVSDDTEEMATVLNSMDVATVLSGGVAEVPTGSYVVPTAGLIFATAPVVTPYLRRKGKETIVESETPKKKKIQEHMDIQIARQVDEEMERDAHRMNEQIARDAEIARIHAKEEL
nr:hypothetical protein [Tanacetum cinerariifolium]